MMHIFFLVSFHFKKCDRNLPPIPKIGSFEDILCHMRLTEVDMDF